jgi:hypothetical protein
MRNKTDLYAWREVFSLWIEGQIFESEREKDRGENSVVDAERRLQWFADQVGRRQLAQMMKFKESRAALEKFVNLNITLLDLKRFQVANEEAARKILKVRLSFLLFLFLFLPVLKAYLVCSAETRQENRSDCVVWISLVRPRGLVLIQKRRYGPGTYPPWTALASSYSPSYFDRHSPSRAAPGGRLFVHDLR